jgi:hypothetical protein
MKSARQAPFRNWENTESWSLAPTCFERWSQAYQDQAPKTAARHVVAFGLRRLRSMLRTGPVLQMRIGLSKSQG